MDIERRLRKPALRYRPSKIATDIGIFSMPDTWAVGSLAARTQRSTITRAIAFLSLILIPSLGSAAIYKCTAQDGGITYTDEPCPADTATQYIDPAAPPWLNESSQTMNATPALPDAKSQSQPEILAILCANDEFKCVAQSAATSVAGTGCQNSEIHPVQQPLPKGSPPASCGGDASANTLKRVLGQERCRGQCIAELPGHVFRSRLQPVQPIRPHDGVPSREANLCRSKLRSSVLEFRRFNLNRRDKDGSTTPRTGADRAPGRVAKRRVNPTCESFRRGSFEAELQMKIKNIVMQLSTVDLRYAGSRRA